MIMATSSLILQKIFIASPGDVGDERALARKAIEMVGSERAFRERLKLVSIAWDQPGVGVAMDAALTPQAAIEKGLDQPSECDIVIVIFWSRIGTVLPDDYATKANGEPYLSGTEWEFLDALQAAKSTGSPAVWLYRRSPPPSFRLDDPQRKDKEAQWDKLESLFASLNNDDGSISGGVNGYETPDQFSRMLEQHLRDQLTTVLQIDDENNKQELNVAQQEKQQQTPVVQENGDASAILWKGSPFPGLKAFNDKQSTIYFGRGRETDQLLAVLSSSQQRFVTVVGASGSGKSSLVAAGLIPRLKAGAILGSRRWCYLRFTPAERGNNPFEALAYAIEQQIADDGMRASDLAQSFYASPDALSDKLPELLAERPENAELLIFIDQFEELFSVSVDEQYRQRFIDFLQHAAVLPKVRIVSTIRADFYPRAFEPLAELFSGSGTFLLAAPGAGALYEMIDRPAKVVPAWNLSKDWSIEC